MAIQKKKVIGIISIVLILFSLVVIVVTTKKAVSNSNSETGITKTPLWASIYIYFNHLIGGRAYWFVDGNGNANLKFW